MKKTLFIGIVIFLSHHFFSAQLPEIAELMKGKNFIGNWINGVVWSPDSASFYYYCENNGKKDIYQYDLKTKKSKKLDMKAISNLPINIEGRYWRYRRNRNENAKKGNKIVYAKGGDLYLYDIKKNKVQRLTTTQPAESNPFFGATAYLIYYTSNNNLFLWNHSSNSLTQLTYFKKKSKPKDKKAKASNKKAAKFYSTEEKKLFKEFQKKQDKRGFGKSEKKITLELKKNEQIRGFLITKDQNHIIFTKSSYENNTKRTEIPYFVTRSGYTKSNPARSKAAEVSVSKQQLYIADLKTKKIKKITLPKENLSIRNLLPSPTGTQFIIIASSSNWKDAYLLMFKINSDKVKIIHHIHNSTWIGYLSFSSIGWINHQWIYFISEEDGYSHLFKLNIKNGQKIQLTKGKYVVNNVQLSPDRKHFYLSSNLTHPGNKNLYRININGKELKRMTPLAGQNRTVISPDFKNITILHSEAHLPWSLYLSKTGKQPVKIKSFISEIYKRYKWTNPPIIKLKAKDGTEIYSRLYEPKNPHPSKPGIIFIHGAGYLQNAHYGWSSYFREYMFNCKLQEAGYYVMDVDYSGSAGYGADFRTRIYRHMGGKDLDDIVTAAEYLRKKFSVKKVGIYGGSYGGFLTLMGMFTKADHFSAGAALRPVTDWAHYSNWYSSNILNNPLDDPEAYSQSSPIYFAEGLKGHLLMCHGMVDKNVHFQDSVRLAQRLIELGKENWELAVYPVEGHSFRTASSWTDEYKRIWKLFERTLL